MADPSIALGTIYATIALNLQQLQEDAKKALATLDDVKAQASESLSGTLGGSGSRAVSAIKSEADGASAAIKQVGAAGTAAGEEAAAGAEKAAAGLKGAGAAAEEGASGIQGFLGKALGIAGTIGTVELAAQGFEFLRDKVSEAMQSGMDANRSLALLAQGLKSTHDASGQTVHSLDDLSTAIMQNSGIDDQAVQSAEQMLLTFTGLGKSVFPRATQAVADMATRMNGGAIPTAQQMNSVALQLGKALNDPAKGLTMLTREGVTFTEQQQKQIKAMVAAGDTAGAQTLMLHELNKEFGGSAAAAGKANGGIAILRAEFENTEQTIGQALIPVVSALTGALMPLAQWAGTIIPEAIQFLTQHADEVKVILAALGVAVSTVVVPALVGLLGPLFAADGAITGLMAGLGTVGLPVLAIAGVLAVLGLALKHAYDTSEPFRHAVQVLGEQLKGLAGVIVGNLQDAFTRILPYLQQLGSWVGGALQGAFQAIVPHLTDFANWLSHASDVIATNVQPVVSALTDALINLFEWVQHTAVPAVQQFASWLGDHLGPVVQQVGVWVQTTLLPALQQFGQWVTDTALPAIGRFADWLGSKAGLALRQAADWTQNTLLPALQRFGDWLQKTALPAIQQFADWLGSKAGQALQQTAAWVQGTLLPALQQFGDWIVNTALPTIEQFASWLKDHLGASFQQTAGWVTTTLLPALQRFGDWVMTTAIPAVQQLGTWLHDHLGPGFSNLQAIVSTVWNVLQPIWQALQAQVQPILAQLSDTLHTSLIPAWDSLKESFDQIKPPIMDLITMIGEQLGPTWDALKPILEVIGAIVGIALVTAIGILVGALTGIIAMLGQVIQGAIKFAGGIIEAIGGALEVVTSIVSGFFTILFDIFHGNWSKIGDDLQKMWGGISDGLQKVVGGIWQAIQGLFQAGIGGALALLQGFVNGFAGAIDAIAHALGVKGNPIPMWQIPGAPGSGSGGSGAGTSAGTTGHGRTAAYAKGTTHHPGGLAIVGEEGPELVHLPAGASVLPAGLTAALLAGGLAGAGMPGYAGGIGDFIGDLFSHLGDGAASLVQQALAAAGVTTKTLTGVLSQMGDGTLGALKGWATTYVGDLLSQITSTTLGNGPVSASAGSAPGLLPGFPLMNQLAQHDVNDLNDCVPTSMASAASFLLKRLVSPVGIKDDVYGSGYVGGQAPDRYKSEMGKLGLTLQDAYGGAQSLVGTIISHLRAGQPVLGSIPSNWNVISQGGPTHEVAFAGYDGGKGLLTAMNPWKGFFQTASPSWWAPRLQYGVVNPLVKLASGGVLREAVAGVGLSSGANYLMGERGPEAVVPLSRVGGGDIYNITVEVVASPVDGAPYQAGVAFGNGFAAGFQQARTQRGL